MKLGDDLLVLTYGTVSRFLLEAGWKKKDLLEFFSTSIETGDFSFISQPAQSRRRLPTETIVLALHKWHRDERYLTSKARPKSLPKSEGAYNLCALLEEEGAGSKADDLISMMLEMKLLRITKSKKYLPIGRVATIRTLHPVLVRHACESVARLLRTVTVNARRKKKNTIIERYAFVPDLDERYVVTFEKYSQLLGTRVLTEIDDWLSQRRVGKSAGRSGRAVGMHLFACVEDPVVPRSTYGKLGKVSTPSAKRAAKSSRRSSSATRT
jgi:hypothetical protein